MVRKYGLLRQQLGSRYCLYPLFDSIPRHQAFSVTTGQPISRGDISVTEDTAQPLLLSTW